MIIGMMGFSQSGKDTAAELLAKDGFERRAFADAIRTVVYKINPLLNGDIRLQEVVDGLGWDVAKVNIPEVRRLLQVTGLEALRETVDEFIWIDAVFDKLESFTDYVITDVRFDNEIEAVEAAGGVLVWVQREGVQPVNSHASDNIVGRDDADIILHNPGNIEGYAKNVSQLAEILLTQDWVRGDKTIEIGAPLESRL